MVFDFDLTILSIHSWGERVRPEDVASRSLEDDVADLEFFRVFVERALASGIKVAIASFGVYEVIQAYMDRAVGPGVFTRANISTPSQHGTKDGHVVRGGKVPQLVVRELPRRARSFPDVPPPSPARASPRRPTLEAPDADPYLDLVEPHGVATVTLLQVAPSSARRGFVGGGRRGLLR